MAKTIYHAANTRGHANHGWLDTFHTFSFAGYHDPERIHFGALRVMNDDMVRAGYGFGKHPHDNMEIITVVLDGALEHADSMGHTQAIHPNEVQVMSAGTGITHSEYNHNKDKDVSLLQIWIFPEKRNVTPRYDQVTFDAAERINKLQMLVSPIENEDAGLKIHQQAWIYRTALEKGKTLEHTMHSDKNGIYVFAIEGSATVNGQLLTKRDGMGISETNSISMRAEEAADLLLLEVPMLL
ncbi:MAG: pirin family protein [Bacteroidota bacterium]